MRKKRIKHSSRVLKRLVIVVIFFILFIALSGIYFEALNLFINKPAIISPLATGKSLNSRQDINNLLVEKHIPFSSIRAASDSSYVVSLSDGGRVILSSKKDLLFQISSLQLVLKRLTIEGKRLKSLNFRYDKPILVY